MDRSHGPDAIIGDHCLCYQASELARRVAAGATEPPLLLSPQTPAIMRTMDEIRRQIKVSYPGE